MKPGSSMESDAQEETGPVRCGASSTVSARSSTMGSRSKALVGERLSSKEPSRGCTGGVGTAA